MKLGMRFRSRAKQRGFIIDPYRFGVAGSSLTPTLSNVVFALHGDEVPWYDVSAAPHGVANYTSTVNTVTKPSFATGSLSIANANSGVRAALGATSTDLQFGTGSWFMEAQIYTSNISGARIFDTRSAPGQPGWVFAITATEELFFQNAGTAYATATAQFSLSTWYHVAASYDGTTLLLFIDGVVKLTQVVALTVNTGQHLAIANTNDMATQANGLPGQYLAEMRIVKGEAVVTTAFTAPTARFADSGNVRSLQTNVTYSNVVLRSTYDSNINDVSNAARTMTAAGSAGVSSARSVFGGSSLLLNTNAATSGKYLTTPDSADFDFGTGDNQFQAWVLRDGSTSTAPAILSTAVAGYGIQVLNSFKLDIYVASVDVIVGEIPLTNDLTWYHVAWGRKDNVLYVFVDGILDRFVSLTSAMNCSTLMHVGRIQAGGTTQDWRGNIDDLQLVKGECQLFKSFLVPTAALPVS